ncbi:MULTISPECIES: hypothetical protein [unclassified Streptomyces]|uniref:hypothetical protein n=1 Tax=unclassified Streptomyces TaxID=2593676 RepID=UPI00224CC6D5|nr:hypothetical protein [Streptomyces sp. NBC_01264]MCX4784049.1 hypothetical protein [Streptomyces sp. NBC_01264]
MARRIAAALRDRLVRLLISVTDRAAARSRVPNPMAGMRVVLTQLADQDLSGGDMIEELNWRLGALGFTWPDGLCDDCNGPLTTDESGLCTACSPCPSALA